MGRHAKHNWKRLLAEFKKGYELDEYTCLTDFARKKQISYDLLRKEFRKLGYENGHKKPKKPVEKDKFSGQNKPVNKRVTLRTICSQSPRASDIDREPIIGGRILDEYGLTLQQETFVNEYLLDFNSTRAAMAAGYSKHTAYAIGYELLRRPVVQRRLQEVAEQDAIRLGITRDRILLEYARIAFANVGDYVEFGQREVQVMGAFGPVYEKSETVDPETKKKIKTQTPIMKTVNFVDFNPSSQIDTALIAEVKQGREGISIKLHDKMKALEKLERYFDVIPDAWKRKVEEERLKIERERLELERQKSGTGDEAEKAHNERVTTLAQLINNPEEDRHIEDFEAEEDE